MKIAIPFVAPIALALGLLASAQHTSTPAPGRPLMPGPVIIPVPESPYFHAPEVPLIPGPATVREGPFHKAPNLPSAPPPTFSFQGEAQSFCTSTYNSTGFAAWMGCAGSLSLCQNATCLLVDGVPQFSPGLFFYGGNPAQIPVANGYLCISPFHPGLFRLPPVTANANMQAHLLLDFDTLPAAGAITPGSTWYFQYWFRDPLGGGAGSNFSDGMRITFCQ